MGVQGAEPPWRGVMGGVPPRKLKKGRVTNPCNPPTSGTQNAGESSANEGGERGGGGGAPWQGVWGMCPQKQKIGDELPTLATQPRGGPKTPANPKPTGVGKWGSRGRSPRFKFPPSF